MDRLQHEFGAATVLSRLNRYLSASEHHWRNQEVPDYHTHTLSIHRLKIQRTTDSQLHASQQTAFDSWDTTPPQHNVAMVTVSHPACTLTIIWT